MVDPCGSSNSLHRHHRTRPSRMQDARMLHHAFSSPMLFRLGAGAGGAEVGPRYPRAPAAALSWASQRRPAVGRAPVGPHTLHGHLAQIAPTKRFVHQHHTTPPQTIPSHVKRRWVSGFVQADLSAILPCFLPPHCHRSHRQRSPHRPAQDGGSNPIPYAQSAIMRSSLANRVAERGPEAQAHLT